MNSVYVIEAVRTPIGKLRGALKEARPDDLLALVIREVLARAEVEGARVDEVYAGCANQAGEDNRNVARMATLLAGLPNTVPAATVNRLCASGLEAIVQGARQIQLGEADVIVAGGVESMTRAPWSTPKPSEAFPGGKLESWDTSLGWRYPNPKLAAMFPLEQMGETAENVAERLKISREDQDRYAIESHQRAVGAQKAGAFAAELVNVEFPQKKGAPVVVSADEQPRIDSTFEKLSTLKAAFRDGGTVTAGNSATLNDGPAAGVLTGRAGNEGQRLTVDVCTGPGISVKELASDIDVLNVVNFGGGTYVLYAEVVGDEIEVDPEAYGDSFAKPARLLPLALRYEARALKGFTEAEAATLKTLLRRVYANPA